MQEFCPLLALLLLLDIQALYNTVLLKTNNMAFYKQTQLPPPHSIQCINVLSVLQECWSLQLKSYLYLFPNLYEIKE